MKITCPSCSARYSIDDAKVKGKAFKFTCKKCGQTHVYRGGVEAAPSSASLAAPAPPPQEAPPPQPAGYDQQGYQQQAYQQQGYEAPAGGYPGEGYDEEAVWYVAVGEEQQGPYTTVQIREYIQTDQLDPESYMWRDGMEDWAPVAQVPEFADFYQGGPPPPEPQAPMPPYGGGEEVTVASPFAAPQGGVADTGDLFSAFGAPGAPAAAAPPQDVSPFGAFGGSGSAAAVAGPAGADIFGGVQPSPFEAPGEEREQDVMMGAAPAVAAPRVDAQRMIGARNENSVLFSLSSLQALATGHQVAGAAAAAVPVAARPGFASGEGSGLIDIRTMATSIKSQEDRPDDMFSLGGGQAPVAVPILTRPIRHADESRRPMFIMIGVIGAFAILIVVLLAVLLTRKEKVVLQPGAPGIAGADGGASLAQANAGDGGTTEPEKGDAGVAAADEDKGTTTAAADGGGDAEPAVKAGDGGEAGAGEPPGPGGPDRPGSRRDAGRRPGGDDHPGPVSYPAEAGSSSGSRDAGSSTPRDTGRRPVTDDLGNLGIRRDAGASQNLPETPSRDQVRSKFEGIRGTVRACTGNQAGTATVQATIQGNSGRVTRVNVGGDFTGQSATCIASAVRGLTFPPFSNPSLTVNYSYRF
jgi:predicted Zn finger-like uncharacterized protein